MACRVYPGIIAISVYRLSTRSGLGADSEFPNGKRPAAGALSLIQYTLNQRRPSRANTLASSNYWGSDRGGSIV
jgi:hypothetical protein